MESLADCHITGSLLTMINGGLNLATVALLWWLKREVKNVESQ